MTSLRIGTRGSDLARTQTQSVCDALAQCDSSLAFEIIVSATDGDMHPTRLIDSNWPIGSFVGAIELALLHKQIDVAVHSYKDLPTTDTPGLIVAATPEREAAHDVLLTAEPVTLHNLPSGMRIGTSSSRRAAQIQKFSKAIAVPIRGNVPTRIAKIGRHGYDGVILAAAGLRRLGITYPHAHDLPLQDFLPAPSQGALAVQVRENDRELMNIVSQINVDAVRTAVCAERTLLKELGGGCTTPVGALAHLENDELTLAGQLFSDDCAKMAYGQMRGTNAAALGEALAKQLLQELSIVQ